MGDVTGLNIGSIVISVIDAIIVDTHRPRGEQQPGGGLTMDERERPDGTTGPSRDPSGELGGHPVNADETAPREHVPIRPMAATGSLGILTRSTTSPARIL